MEVIKRLLIGAAAVLTLAGGVAVGQVQFEAHTICGGELNPSGVSTDFAIDVDGDRDIDLLSGYSYGIFWYENDGLENFASHVITNQVLGVESVIALDLDGDSDIDLLSASQWDDTIAWHENDGSENFTTHIIASDAEYADKVRIFV